jgi:hypothetical protein
VRCLAAWNSQCHTHCRNFRFKILVVSWWQFKHFSYSVKFLTFEECKPKCLWNTHKPNFRVLSVIRISIVSEYKQKTHIRWKHNYTYSFCLPVYLNYSNFPYMTDKFLGYLTIFFNSMITYVRMLVFERIIKWKVFGRWRVLIYPLCLSYLYRLHVPSKAKLWISYILYMYCYMFPPIYMAFIR